MATRASDSTQKSENEPFRARKRGRAQARHIVQLIVRTSKSFRRERGYRWRSSLGIDAKRVHVHIVSLVDRHRRPYGGYHHVAPLFRA